ncbi:conserved hypothetical protein [Talaromyces stipitatus ATCC 10500]|uniref:Autophagy protein n=1 Tax=Talaromyces stipitatus (strain ATCC 10500 / CBS 375.48 / QM 6759 / NRRL 1006) TaxID=441959 RepID=B8MGW8_TALSN|nr:uncharacterized protein TSTA_014400 [Talaromyces stipitatus ATCC 10500]EED16349.1 conserved hypothetical protein [Talaromyces stipitatus ATCC 10500]
MGWFWGNSNQEDPTKKLDPELQDYLKKERPATYTTVVRPSRETPTEPQTPSSQPDTNNATEGKSAVPAASLYPDGRYAHLWKTYKPLADVEATDNSNSAQRVVERLKRRKDSVHSAAMENCAIEHEGLTTCFNKSDWMSMIKARATMCSDENRKFSRCYTTQAKFLQALGYASSLDYDEEREERIQMHADKLYHQMLDYESRVAEARAAGQEPPPITSLFNPNAKPVPANDGKTIIIPGAEQLPEGYKLPASLDKLSPHERELEIQSIKAEIEQKEIYSEAAAPFVKVQQESQMKRQEKAKSWFGETLGKWIT